MANYILCVVMLVAVVEARRPHHNPKFPFKTDQDYRSTIAEGEYTKVACTKSFRTGRDELIKSSGCGAPREVFVSLTPKVPHEEVSPRAVWVKRCVGLCEFDSEGSCAPSAIVKREIPVRIRNVETRKEMCAMYTVDEHVSCQCCNLKEGDCPAPKVYVPRKCACQCPNTVERRECLRKSNMRWNRSKCACEERRRMRV